MHNYLICVWSVGVPAHWRTALQGASRQGTCAGAANLRTIGRGADTVGNPYRAQISQFELFELILLLKLYNSLSSNSSRQYLSQQYPPPPLRTKILDSRGTFVSKAPQGNERRAMDSKNPPAHYNPCFSARHGSRSPGFVLISLPTYAIASLGVAYDRNGVSRTCPFVHVVFNVRLVPTNTMGKINDEIAILH